ncbi:MAG: hypothetical protein VW405_08755 [Rhodospirillaceae bacterium]
MNTTLFAWVELSVLWLSPSVTLSAGPVVWSSTPTLRLEADTVIVEPASISYEFVSREVELQTRVEAFLVVP